MNTDVEEVYYKGHEISKFKPKNNVIKLNSALKNFNLKKELDKKGYKFEDLSNVTIISGYYVSKVAIEIEISEERAIIIAKQSIDKKIKREVDKIIKIKDKLEETKKKLEKTLEESSSYERYMDIEAT